MNDDADETPELGNLPDYEVEFVTRGGKFAAFGYVAVRGSSTREALEHALGLNHPTEVAWRDASDASVRWDDFFTQDMDLEVADVTPFGSKWSLRKFSQAR